jgi:hypothetical protein
MATLEPEVILFVGEIAYGWPIVAPILQRELKANALIDGAPRIVCAGDTNKAHILGAAAVVLQRHSGYYSSEMKYAGQPMGAAEPHRRA